MADNSFPVTVMGGGNQNANMLYPNGQVAISFAYDGSGDTPNHIYMTVWDSSGTEVISINPVIGCRLSQLIGLNGTMILMAGSVVYDSNGGTVLDEFGNYGDGSQSAVVNVLNASDVVALGLHGAGSAPTVTVDTAGSGVGAGADFSSDSNPTNTAFRVRLNTAAGGAAGARLFSITFSRPFAVKPKVVSSVSTNMSGNQAAAYVDQATITTNGFDFKASSSAAWAAGSWWIDFIVIA